MIIEALASSDMQRYPPIMLIFQFPGQGSQSVGMGRKLADEFSVAKEVFDQVDSALDQSLSALMADGPIESLTLTENAQPALMAVSLAIMAVLKAEFDIGIEQAAYVAGHSLGEYTALTAAGALTLSDSARLLKLRGQAMQRAGTGYWCNGFFNWPKGRFGFGRGRSGRRFKIWYLRRSQ